MSIQEIVKILTDAGIAQNEANIEVKLLLEHFCNFKPMDIIFGKTLDESKLAIVKQKAIERVTTNTPVQYIMGFGYFMGEKFAVNKDVLIPRDETEILATKAIEIALKTDAKKVLDIGTGTGCLACTIASRTDAQALGVDISNEALSVALDNASKLNLNNRAIFRKSDLFSNVKPEEKFDIIVSNPPYIPRKDKETLQVEVQMEPELALFTNDDKGLEFYEKIIAQTQNFLKPNGYILFEMGMGQSKDIENLLKQNGFKDIEIEKDLAGIDRVIIAHI